MHRDIVTMRLIISNNYYRQFRIASISTRLYLLESILVQQRGSLMKYYFLLLVFFGLSVNSYGEEILRSVEYSVSPDMTLNEARDHAIKQLRMTIISEVGVLVEAQIKSNINDGSASESVNYSNVFAGNISLKVVDEIYDGNSLFMNVRAEINKHEILEILARVYRFTKFEKILRELELSKNDLDKLASENKLLKAKLNIIKGQVRYIEKSVVSSKKIKSKLLDIKNNIESARQLAVNRIDTEERLANEYIKLSAELFTNGMLYAEFSDVIDVIDIREYYGSALSTNCRYMNKTRNNLYMVTKKTFNNSEYIYGIEVDPASKKITKLGFFESNYEKSISHCRISYVRVSIEDIMHVTL